MKSTEEILIEFDEVFRLYEEILKEEDKLEYRIKLEKRNEENGTSGGL